MSSEVCRLRNAEMLFDEETWDITRPRSPPSSFIQTSAPIQDFKCDYDPGDIATMFDTCLLHHETSDVSFLELLIQTNRLSLSSK